MKCSVRSFESPMWVYAPKVIYTYVIMYSLSCCILVAFIVDLLLVTDSPRLNISQKPSTEDLLYVQGH